MGQFEESLKAGVKRTNPRKELEDVVAAAAAPDSDNDSDTAEIQRLQTVKNLVNEVHAEKPDPRLSKASTLLQQAIDQEKTEDPAGD